MNTVDVKYSVLQVFQQSRQQELWRKVPTFGVYLQHLRGGDERAKSSRT